MSAPNFYKKNATNYYVIEANEEEEYGFDFYYIQSELETYGFDAYLMGHLRRDGDRNYPSIGFADKIVEAVIGEVSVTLCFEAVLRCGYHSAAILDFECRVSIMDDFGNNLEYDLEDTQYLFRQWKNEEYESKLNKELIISFILSECKKVDDALSSLGKNYIKACQFSNGEAIYEEMLEDKC